MSLRTTLPAFGSGRWSRFAERLLPLPSSIDASLERPAQVLRALVLIHLVVNVVGMIVAPFAGPSPVEWVVGGGGLVVVLVALALLRGGRVRASAILEMGALSLLTSMLVVLDGNNASGASGILVAVILAAGLLLGRSAVRYATLYALLLATMIYAASYQRVAGVNEDPFYGFGEYLLAIAAILFGATLVAYGLSVLEGVLERSRRDAEALRASEERWRSYIERANDLIFTLDGHGKLSTVNRAVLKTLGYTHEELIGEPALKFVAPVDRERAAQAIAKVLGGETTDQWQYEILTKGGRSILTEIRSRAVFKDGKIVGSLHNARDLSDRRRAEEAMRQAQTLESLRVLSGGVAHDFNNLLTAMLGKASAAEELLPADSAARQPVRGVIHAAERAAALTRQLLAYAGRTVFRIEVVDLNAIIDAERGLLEAGMPGGVRLEIDQAGDLPSIEADTAQLQQVTMNLVLNAAQACEPNGGLVHLVTDVVHLPNGLPAVESRTRQALPPGRYVRLTVRDEGDGMEQSTLGRMFDPFFSTKPDGHGLGLASVLGIVRGHNGGLLVESEPGVGTTFRLLFAAVAAVAKEGEGDREGENVADLEFGTQKREPKAKAPAASRQPGGATLGGITMSDTSRSLRLADGDIGATGGSNTVLVIDDEASVREAIGDILAVRGTPILEAEDGRTGLELAAAHRNEIALILLDLTMPGLTGEETCRRLRQSVPELPVVLISGYTETEIDERYESIGVSEFLAKPFNFATLTELVEWFVEQAG